MKQLLLALVPGPEPSLENFFPGRNAELHAALYAVVSGTSAERCLYLWGQTGCGRTHLLKAMESSFRGRGVPTCYVAAAGPWPEVHEELAALLIDDVECLDVSAQAGFFYSYNRLRERQGIVVAAGNAPPAKLGLRPDLLTRLGWGLTYQVYALSDAEKGQALKTHAAARAFELPEEVIEYLLRHFQRDLPSLIGVLEALDRYSMQTHRLITVPLLRELLQGGHAPGPPA